jgi:hypothetical protein
VVGAPHGAPPRWYFAVQSRSNTNFLGQHHNSSKSQSTLFHQPTHQHITKTNNKDVQFPTQKSLQQQRKRTWHPGCSLFPAHIYLQEELRMHASICQWLRIRRLQTLVALASLPSEISSHNLEGGFGELRGLQDTLGQMACRILNTAPCPHRVDGKVKPFVRCCNSFLCVLEEEVRCKEIFSLLWSKEE